MLQQWLIVGAIFAVPLILFIALEAVGIVHGRKARAVAQRRKQPPARQSR